MGHEIPGQDFIDWYLDPFTKPRAKFGSALRCGTPHRLEVALRVESQAFGHDGPVKMNSKLRDSEERFVTAEQNG